MPAQRHLSRVIVLLAGTAALLATILPPIGYFGLASRYQQGMLSAIAELEADHVAMLVTTAPDLWKYQQIRLDELLERRPGMGKAQLRRITDLEGQVIAENGDLPQGPSIKGVFLIHDAGVPVARIEIVQSLRPIIFQAFFVFLGCAGIAVLVFRAAQVLPTRAFAAAQRSLAESEQKYRNLFLGMHEAVLLLEFGDDLADATVVEVNPACNHLFFGCFPSLVGLQSVQIFGELHQELMGLFQQVLQNEITLSVEKELPGLDKVVEISVTPAGKGRLAIIFSDVTEHRAAERQVQQLASFDFLTGLPNRALLNDRLKQAMLACSRQQCKVAVPWGCTMK